MGNSLIRNMARSGVLYLYLAFLVELMLVIYLRNDAGYIMSPLLMIASGLFIAYYPLKCNLANNLIEVNNITDKLVPRSPRNFWLLAIGLALAYVVWSAILFQRHPIDVQQSDILPFIKDVYLERLAKGEPVYSLYTGFQYGTFRPGYLPAHWMPYILPYLMGIDLRWACVLLFVTASLILTRQVTRQNPTTAGLMAIILPYLLVFSIYLKQGKDAAHTIEIMVTGYYLLLAVSMFSNNALARATGVCLPLLSRYAFVFWLPVYALVRLFEHPKRALYMAGFGAMLLALVFVPFFLQTPDMFNGFNGNYLNGVILEWQGQPWQKPGDKPFQLFQGMGFASWYYEFGTGSLQEKIVAIKDTLVWVSIGVTCVQMLLVYMLRKRNNSGLISLLTLKAALTLFYPFIMVPYIYLNWVPLMISVAILSRITLKANTPLHENIHS